MEIKNKKVLLRADFNVPLKDSVVKDNYRIISTFSTFDLLKNGNNKTIILSHIETKNVDKPTLKPIFEYIKNNNLEYNIEFSDNLDDLKNKFENLNPGGFILFENIRNFSGEKDDDIELAKIFKNLTDIYINDAFAVSHRKHMSVSVLPSLYEKDFKMFGIQMKKEIDNLSKILNPQKPFAVILSGAKFSTKLPLIEKYLNSADKVFISGALFNNVLKSLGYNVGKSLIDNEINSIDELVKKENFKEKVFIPNKIVSKNHDEINVLNIDQIKNDDSVQDMSDESVNDFVDLLKTDNYKTIVWNGPLGYYEDDNFKKGTLSMAKKLFEYIQENDQANLFIGGGDTVAAINTLNIKNDRVFVSTGGGAMLEFLEKDGNIPGVVNII